MTGSSASNALLPTKSTSGFTPIASTWGQSSSPIHRNASWNRQSDPVSLCLFHCLAKAPSTEGAFLFALSTRVLLLLGNFNHCVTNHVTVQCVASLHFISDDFLVARCLFVELNSFVKIRVKDSARFCIDAS